MADLDPHNMARTGKRTPVTLKIKFKSETIEQFIERYAVDVSQGGIFIRTKEPLAVGTQMKFEFQLRDASPLIAGEGTVVWTRENDPSRPAIAPGMGVRFDKLADGSPSVLERILAEKSKQQPQRAPADTTKPPLFTDTPTRVAPAPVQDMLHGGGSSRPARGRADSQETPLPRPMPFHSDADEFPEEAFEEATKVRSLDELVAQTAQTDSGDPARDLFGSGPASQTTIIPPDELALRRHQARMDQTIDEAAASSPLIEPPEPAPGPKHIIDRDSAPGLPSPPSVDSGGARAPRLLDTSPSPRTEGLATDLPPAKTRIGLEPAKVETKPGHVPAAAYTAPPAVAAAAAMSRASVATPIAAPAKAAASSSMGSMRPLSEPSRPATRPSIAPIVVIVIAFVAAAAAAVWFFVLKDTVSEDDVLAHKAPLGTPTPGVDPTPTPNVPPMPTNGSAGASIDNGGTAVVTPGSAATPIPAVKTVDTVIASSVDKATVTIDEPALRGAAPFTAKLEPGKTYKAHISATGYATLDLDIKGGQTGISAKLVAKPKLLTVTSDPPGAQIIIDGTSMNHVTPFDVDLKQFAGKGKVRVTLRKAGYRQLDESIDVSSPSDAGGKMMVTAPIVSLAVAPVVVRPPVVHPPVGSAVGPSDAGTSETPPGPGSSATVPETTTTPTPAPPPPTPTPAGSGTAGNGEPEPDFAK